MTGRVSNGIPGLDDLIEGGLVKNSINLAEINKGINKDSPERIRPARNRLNIGSLPAIFFLANAKAAIEPIKRFKPNANSVTYKLFL